MCTTVQFEQQQYLKEGLLNDHPACAFAKLLSTNLPTQYLATQFGSVPTGCVLSYQALKCDKPQVSRESPSDLLPALPLDVIKNVPCVFDIESEEEHAQLSKMNMTLDDLNKVHANNPNQLSGRNHRLEGSLHHSL